MATQIHHKLAYETKNRMTVKPGPLLSILEATSPLSVGESVHHVMLAWVADLGDPQLVAKRPMKVLVEKADEDNYIAAFADANINASGDTFDESVANLVDIVAAKYRHFSNNQAVLGPIPKKQLQVLGQYIRRR